MHVLIIPSWYFPPETNEIGGRMFHHLASGLREKDIDARILFADFSPGSPFKKQVTFTEESGVPTWRVRQWFPPKFNKKMIEWWIGKYVNSILDYFEKEGIPDIIHAQSYMAGMVCAELNRRTKIPFILSERASSFITQNIPSRHASFIQNNLNAASAITCVSPGLKSYLAKYTNKPIEVIPNYYDPAIFYSDPNIPKYEKFTWVSVGEPAHIKGLDLLIKAFAKVKQQFINIEMQLILVDRIRGQQELIDLSKQLNIEKEISWIGLVSQVQVAGILRQSHVLISASRTETFGKAILEAQACGIPVVATKTDGATYIMSSQEQGIMVELNDIDALTHGMSEMYFNYQHYNPASILSHVESRFRKNIVIQQWIDLYTKIGA